MPAHPTVAGIVRSGGEVQDPHLANARRLTVHAARELVDHLVYTLVIHLEPLAVRRPHLRRILRRILTWVVEPGDRCVTVRPVADLVAHTRNDIDCVCAPAVEWSDPDDGEPYDIPVVSHHALDGRD